MSWGVSLTNVNFGWPDKPIAENLSLSVDFSQLAQRLPVIGLSGVGKSTLLYVMAGLMNPSAGAVSWTFPDGERARVWRRHAPVTSPETAYSGDAPGAVR